MNQFLQQVVNGLGNGSLYATMGIAFVLVFRATGSVNFAQAEMALFTTFLAWQVHAWGVPFWLTAILVLAASFPIGVAVERLFIKPMRHKPELATMLITLGLFLLINQLCGLLWPGTQREVPSMLPQGSNHFGGLVVSTESIYLLGVLGLEGLALYLFFSHTRSGLRTRAVADNPESAVLHGIHPDRMFALAWGMAAVFGCLAGLLIAPAVVLTTGMMFPILVYGLSAATLGGLTNPFGAIAGGLIVGIAENLAATYVPLVGTDLKIAVPLLIIFLTLLVRPAGLFGAKEVSRV